MRWAVLLRGVNVGGVRKVAMRELTTLAEGLGHSQVCSYLQSGNLVLTSSRQAADIAAQLKSAIGCSFGVPDVEVLVRNSSELSALLDANPFATAGGAPATCHLTFLAGRPQNALHDEGSWQPDRFAVRGREVFVLCPNGYGRTKLNNAFFEKKLGVSATTRNWNTVRALADMTRT